MQDQQRTIGSLPGIASLLQRPSSSGTDMNQQTSLSHMQNAVGTQLSDHMRSSVETISSCASGLDVQSFSGWNSGGPSCSLNLHNQVDADDLKTDHGRSSSSSAHPEDGVGPEERQFESNSVTFPVSSSANLRGNQSRIEPFFLQGSSSNHGTQNVGLNMERIPDTANRGKSTVVSSGLNFLNGSGLDREKASLGTSFCDHIGSSSGSSCYMDGEENTSSRSSLVDWGSSCKRKAFEGSSGQLCTGGSSSSSVEPESGRWHTIPADLNASSNSSVSASLGDNTVASPSVQQNTENEVREVVSDAFPSLGVLENVERPSRNFDRRIGHAYCQESVPLNLSSTGSARRSSHSLLRRIPSSNPFNDSLELRLTAGVTAASSSASQSQSHAMHIPGLSGNLHSVPWDGAANPRGTNISTSYISGDRAVREDLNLGIFPRDSTENPMPVPPSSVHDPASWHVSSSSSEGVPPSWIGSSSSVHSLPNASWIVHQEVSPQNQQRLPEFGPWSFFPSASSVSGFHNGQSSSSSSGPPPFTEETGNHQTYPRSTSLMERRGDNVFTAPHSLRALAVDIEGRRRLISEIRQVLNAMRRGENLRAEDYMFFDPFVYHGMAEMHDRHRDMRLDVDNMSYEELLALEEHIGDVSTGLSEDIIMKLMKQRVFMSTMTESSSDLEPCCICQEEYADGDDVGSLDCGHEFHINCIKQWLQQKNLCPICKTAALTA